MTVAAHDTVGDDDEEFPARSLRPLTLRVSDVTGQKLMRVRIPAGDKETTISELIENMRGRMQLQKEANGRPLTYSARLERERPDICKDPSACRMPCAKMICWC